LHLELFAGPSPKITRRYVEQARTIMESRASSICADEAARRQKKAQVIAIHYEQQHEALAGAHG
jgi:hypothetical protein